jgi:hypothetical protein
MRDLSACAPRWPGTGLLTALALVVASGGGVTTAHAQAAWDTHRALELVDRARERRQAPILDESLLSYKADVAGHIYFFLDRPGDPDPVLLRADQVALDLYWATPDRVKQVIRGMRHEEQFPIRDFRYYLDRYTVIHDGFGDEIRVGEGRDVRNVPHPLAPGAEEVYQYRLTDSTAIRLPGEPEPIRVYEVQVRPRSFDTPAIVGSLFIERARADLVRLAFTFTRSAYLDPRNERVEIMLENALWEGRHWLPREQRLLVRRELPEFDFGVGTVIRAALRVTDYELNPALPTGFFAGPPVVAAAGPEGLRSYPFQTGLFDGFEAVGLVPGQEPATLDEVNLDAIAGRMLREQYLRGVPRVRPFAPTGSDLVRYGRGEGLVTGAGLSTGIGLAQLYVYGGYAWGARDPLAQLGWRPLGPAPRPRLLAEAYLNMPRELGLREPAAGILSTVSAAFGTDPRDTHPASGIAAGIRVGDARTGVFRLRLRGEAHRASAQADVTAPLAGGQAFRPVAPVEEGRRVFLDARYERRFRLGPVATTVRPALEVGHADFEESGAFGRTLLGIDASWVAAARHAGADMRVTAAAAMGARPPQHYWYLGGSNTLPGYPGHAFVGDRAAVVDLTGWRDLVPRLVRLRALAAAGWAGIDGVAPAPAIEAGLAPWEPGPTDGIRTSIGLGLGLVHDILRLDYVVRTDTGAGTFILSVDPRFWDLL